MKMLYISEICKNSSFGEISRKYIEMFKKYCNIDIYLLNINNTISYIDQEIIECKNIKKINFLPDYYLNENNKEQVKLYLIGFFHISEYIINLQPDIVIMLFYDNDIKLIQELIETIKPQWKGLFIPLFTINYINIPLKMLDSNYDGCIFTNKISMNEVKNKTKNKFPAYYCPHIVNGFSSLSHEEKIKLRKKIHGENSNKYIIGWINSNNSRKRLDLVITAFIKFYKYYPNSILYIKTTKSRVCLNTTCYYNIEKVKYDYPIQINSEYLNNTRLNELYNTFNIMINATDGEGFGLTPFEAALCNVLTILPNNTSYKSLITNNEIPNYLIPCKQYPYMYARTTTDIIKRIEGNELFSIYYDFKSYENKLSYSENFIPLIHENIKGVTTFILSKKLEPDYNVVFSDIKGILDSNWDVLQIQFLITSDLETVRYMLFWLKDNTEYTWPGKNRNRLLLKISSLQDFVGYENPTVGLINIEDMVFKMIYYYKNYDQYQKDVLCLKNYVLNNFSDLAVSKHFNNIINKLES